MATAPIRHLAWEPPYAAGVAQEITKRQKDKKKKKELGPQAEQDEAQNELKVGYR